MMLKQRGGLVALLAALFLATSALWATDAESAPKPVSEDNFAEVQLLTFNDFHGNLEPVSTGLPDCPTAGGAAYLGAYLDLYEQQNPDGTIRVHAGDSVGGSPLISSYFHDEPTIEAMNLMDLDVGTLGNHEFDEGGEEMLRLIKGGQRDDGGEFKIGPDGEPINTSDPDFAGADFPYISANVVYADTGEPVLDPYTIVERDGVKIGFIGVTTPETEQIVVPDAVAPFDFLDISDTVDRYTAELQEQGVETIVVLAHSGAGQTGSNKATGEIITETRQMNDEVDVVVAGHSHSRLNAKIDGKLVVQAYSYGTAFADVDLVINRDTGDIVKSSAEIVRTCTDGIEPDPELAALVAEYQTAIEPIAGRVVGTAAETITRDAPSDLTPAGESALGDLIADAQRAYSDADFAFMNPGGIRANIEAGEVTYAELFAVQPFDNGLVTMELTGEQIYRLLEQQFRADGSATILQVSGLKYTYNPTSPVGSKITSVTLPDGTALAPDPNTTYTVAVNGYLATGGDGFTVFTEGQNVQTEGGDLEALVAYIQSLGQPFTAPDPYTELRISTTTP
jgi:5'-nucleotidase